MPKVEPKKIRVYVDFIIPGQEPILTGAVIDLKTSKSTKVDWIAFMMEECGYNIKQHIKKREENAKRKKKR